MNDNKYSYDTKTKYVSEYLKDDNKLYHGLEIENKPQEYKTTNDYKVLNADKFEDLDIQTELEEYNKNTPDYSMPKYSIESQEKLEYSLSKPIRFTKTYKIAND